MNGGIAACAGAVDLIIYGIHRIALSLTPVIIPVIKVIILAVQGDRNTKNNEEYPNKFHLQFMTE
jgi:hypothetical protein